MTKMNYTEKQTAFEYAIYMIAASYFKKAKCSNIFREKSMRLQFLEQKLDSQYHMEETCIKYLENRLLKELPEQLWTNEVLVKLVKHPVDAVTEIRFICPSYILSLKGECRGRRYFLTHHLWVRKA